MMFVKIHFVRASRRSGSVSQGRSTSYSMISDSKKSGILLSTTCITGDGKLGSVFRFLWTACLVIRQRFWMSFDAKSFGKIIGHPFIFLMVCATLTHVNV